MATIPIEVIVQDVESPANPTPTPETNSTEESIAVPDTGAGTKGNDSTFSSSSVASIIIPAVLLVLALGTICTSLIHRHHRRQDNKASKKEKLAAAASATTAVLAATVLIGNLVLPATKAATSDTIDGITPSEDKVSITVTRDGGSAEASIESTATITSTSDFGYKVLLSMAEGVETSNLYLNGDEASEHYIAATESTELGDNTWGYALTEDGEYSAVPLLDTPATVAEGDEPAEDEVLSIYYGVKVNSDLPTGTYSGGEIEYTLEAQEPTLPITYMQDLATLSEEDKTALIGSMPEGYQFTLKDSRDQKEYFVSKLADGNVWMTQNLDLEKEDLIGGIAIDNDNTDNPDPSFELPDSQVSGNDSWSSESGATNTAHVYDLAGNGQKYYHCSEYEPWGECRTHSDKEISPKDLGNYYNWYAATAGTGTSNLGNNQVANGSICPVGWRLPNNINGGDVTDYSNLLYVYNIIDSPTSSHDIIMSNAPKIYQAPINFMRAGYYSDGVSMLAGVGHLWLAISETSGGAYYLNFYNSSIYPWYSGNKTEGNSVRCVAR